MYKVEASKGELKGGGGGRGLSMVNYTNNCSCVGCLRSQL